MDHTIIKSLKEIRTPIAFLSLTILVSEFLLFSLIGKVDGINLTIVTIGMVFLPFVIVLVFYLLYKNKINKYEGSEVIETVETKYKNKQYDLFVSVPMASFNNPSEYESSRKSIIEIIDTLKQTCDFEKVFYAGLDIETPGQFEAEDISIAEDYEILKNSEQFILIYPQSLPSSALIELGWAMVMKKPIIIFVKNRDDLPYLMRHADRVYKNIAIYTFNNDEDIKRKFEVNGKRLFTLIDEIK